MTNISNKQQRKIAKAATINIITSTKSDKNKKLGKPPTRSVIKNTKRLNSTPDRMERHIDRIESLNRRGQFEEAANIGERAQTTAGIRLDAMLSPKLDNKLARLENLGPKSGFLSKAKKK
jgi:hypothetical protein